MSLPFYYRAVIPQDFRSRLRRIPLKLILFICGLVLLFGFDRRGFLPTMWIVIWAAIFTAKLALNVKRKVAEKQLQAKQ